MGFVPLLIFFGVCWFLVGLAVGFICFWRGEEE